MPPPSGPDGEYNYMGAWNYTSTDVQRGISVYEEWTLYPDMTFIRTRHTVNLSSPIDESLTDLWRGEYEVLSDGRLWTLVNWYQPPRSTARQLYFIWIYNFSYNEFEDTLSIDNVVLNRMAL